MGVLRALSRFRSALREGWADPATHYGSVFHGKYVLRDRRISGTVAHLFRASRRPPASILVVRHGDIIGSTDQFDHGDRMWRFSVDLALDITSDDILGSRLKVFAVDRVGSRNELQPDGAAELNFVKQKFDQPPVTELIVDFSQGGNSREYVREGWHGPAKEHTWTDGVRSAIELTVGEPGSRYGIEIVAWPFVIRGKIPEQRLTIAIGAVQLGKFLVKQGYQTIECDIPPDLTLAGRLTILFDHPDAARPRDLLVNADGRRMAFAFKTVKLKRYLPRPYQACGAGLSAATDGSLSHTIRS
jgi:hypothetical protein